jgi:hypothetical protein
MTVHAQNNFTELPHSTSFTPNTLCYNICLLFCCNNEERSIHIDSMVPNNDKMYKAVVALNNAGVELLQHQRSIDGLLTLKDALMLMKSSYQHDETSEVSALQVDEVNKALQAAWHRTSRMHENASKSHEVTIVSITDHDSPFDVHNTLKQNPDNVCCVKIEADDVEIFSHDSDRYDVEASIIMYNYGIAHLFASAQTSATRTNDQTAYHLFELAQSVIDTNVACLDDAAIPSNILLVSMLTSTYLYQLSYHAEYERNATKHLLSLEWVLSTIIYQESLYSSLSPSAAASA